MSVGPTMPMPTAKTPVLTSKRACSWLKMACSSAVPPRPPNCLGQVMPAQPPSYSVRCHSLQRSTWRPSSTPRRNRLSELSSSVRAVACCSSHARASARNAASSGVSSKSTGDLTGADDGDLLRLADELPHDRAELGRVPPVALVLLGPHAPV